MARPLIEELFLQLPLLHKPERKTNKIFLISSASNSKENYLKNRYQLKLSVLSGQPTIKTFFVASQIKGEKKTCVQLVQPNFLVKS